MEHYEIKQLLELPAIRLLTSPNAAMILAFFHRVFKRSSRVAVPEGELRALLDSYLTDIRESDPGAYPDTPVNYLAAWRDEKHGFLRRSYADGQDEPIFELTSGAEKALFWIESLKQVEFVGTESRLVSIFAGLEEIIRYGSDDVDERIRLLNEDMSRIQCEIDRIYATGAIEKYSAVKLNERYARLITTARELLSDFRAVEETFQRIAQEIAEHYVQPGITKGEIVGQMLDSHDALKQSAQGQSFYAFRELLLSPERQIRFDDSVEKVQEFSALSPELKASPVLSHLIGRLLAEDQTVLASAQRVSTNLRRVLDTSNLDEKRKVAEAVREIKKFALDIRKSTTPEEYIFAIQEVVDPYPGMTRTLWKEPSRIAPLGALEIEDDQFGLEEMRRFRNLPQIRMSDLRKNIDHCLEADETVILASVLDAFPPQHGMIEVLGYLIIAAQEDRHYISDADSTEIILPSGRAWQVPQVLFGRGYKQ